MMRRSLHCCPNPRSPMPRPRNRVSGVTLIELMIAMTLGLAIVAAVGYVYVSGSQGFRVQDAQSRAQEDGRFVIDTLSRDIRMAGYFGCDKPAYVGSQGTLEVVASQPVMTLDTTWLMASGSDSKATDRFVDLQYLVRGMTPTEAASHAGLPANVKAVTAGSGRLPGTDVLMILRSGDDAQTVIPNADPRNTVRFSVTAKVAGTGSNPTMVVSDCQTAKIFKPSVKPAAAGVIPIQADNGLNRNNNASGEIDDLNYYFNSDAVLTNFEPVIYYVAQPTSTNPSPTLRRIGIVSNSPTNTGAWATNGGDTVATGVEAFTLAFTVVGSTTEKLTADMSTADWPNVTAVRVRFTMVAAENITRTAQTTQTVGGVSVTDAKLRQSYDFVAGVRGRQYSAGF